MGTPNTFGEKHQVQLKIGKPEDQKMKHYVIDERVAASMPDGVYVGWEGVVVIHKRKVLCTFSKLNDKWSGQLDLHKVLKCQIKEERCDFCLHSVDDCDCSDADVDPEMGAKG